jgi:hypothetical protein
MSTETRLPKKARKTTGPDDWDGWSSYLADRRTPIDPFRLIPSRKATPLRWALPEEAGDATRHLIKTVHRWVRKGQAEASDLAELLEAWVSAAEGRSTDAGFALECLAWAYVLPRLAPVLPAAPWCEVFDYLTELPKRVEGGDVTDKPLAYQLLGGELPLALSYLFPELGPCRKLAPVAKERLSRGVKELLDGNGLPAARHLADLRPLLACWTRCGYLSRGMKTRCFDKDARRQYEWFVRRALQLTRQDGGEVLGNGRFDKAVAELFDAALMLAGDPDDNAIADQVLPGRKASRKKSRRKVHFPESADHSVWAEMAILRPNWLRGGEHLLITHSDRKVNTELNCGSVTVWSGEWNSRIAADGRQLDLEADWQETVWHSDDDVDYMELEAELSDGWRLQRQVLLAREDHFLFTADALLGEKEADIDYRSMLPLQQDIRFEPAKETREGFLAGSRRVGLAMPLALPEWRTAKVDGVLEAGGSGLELRQRVRASRLYAPLFVDLDRKRMRKQRTWRQLTVAEKLEVQPPSVAVGYRVQVGDEQWLFYRSLTPPANRTLLGQNLFNEFFAARFDRHGEAEELVGIGVED